MAKTRLFSLALLFLLAGCQDKPVQQTNTKPPVDPKRAAMDESIAKTTPEGKKILEKVLAMKPEINGQKSTKTLSAVVDNYAKNQSQFNLVVIGWSASQKKSGRWKAVLHYQDFNKQYQDAEWEYNPETDNLYPFDKDNAKVFWSSDPPAGAKKS